MPNWVKNKIVAYSKKDFEKLLELTRVDKYGETHFDFNKIIAEPKTITECPAEYIIKENENAHLMLEDDKTWFNWYDWHCDFWGTKWNACETYIDESTQTIEFDTAWSVATPIAEKLEKLGIEFTWWWSEEQMLEYGGSFESDNGNLIINEFEEHSKEMYDVACMLWGEDEHIKYNEETDSYEWNWEDE